MTLEELEKLKKRDLRQRINDCFVSADSRGIEERPGHIAEAEFYLRELQNRRDSWTSRRDLFLEIVVIALIGWEIYMSYRAERLQKANFASEQAVYENLEKSSGATADTLVAVRNTMFGMRTALDKQIELFYDVQINVVYNEGTKKLMLLNNGRANVTVWCYRLESNVPMLTLDKPTTITPGGGTYEIPLDVPEQNLPNVLPKGQEAKNGYTFEIKNEKQEKFTVEGELVAFWSAGKATFGVRSNLIVPGWKKP